MNAPARRPPALLIAAAVLAAHGVGLRGLAGYGLAWGGVVFGSHIGVTALGLRLAPPGTAPLDTVAVVLLVLPAAVLVRCVHTRTPELDAARARPRWPYAWAWEAGLGAVAVASPLVVAVLLHPAVSTRTFVGDWYLTVGVCLLLGAVTTPLAGAAGACVLLGLCSAPGLVPWQANVVYNTALADVTLALGAAVLVAGVAAAALARRPPVAG